MQHEDATNGFSKESTSKSNNTPSLVLTNVIIVIENIFRRLNARQLNTCSRVCTVWRDQAQREKSFRTKKYRYNCFTFDDEFDCDQWKETVQSYILDCPFTPSCVLMFCSTVLWGQLVAQSMGRKRKRKNKLHAKDVLIPCVPTDCAIQIIISDGIVGTDSNNKSQEFEDCQTAASVLMIGSFPGVEFINFSIARSDWSDLSNFWTQNSSKKPPCLKQLANKEVKMFNLFCPMSGIDQEVCYALFKMFGWPLIAGGFVNKRSMRETSGEFHSTNHSSCMVSGLALCGEQVQVAAVLLRSYVVREEDAKKLIKNLLDYNFPLDDCFGLMYACVGRGKYLYNKRNVEADTFKQYFPNVPLVGFFGNGEIGCSFPQPGLMPVHSLPTPKKRGKGQEELSPAQVKRHIAHLKLKLEEYRVKHVPKILHNYTTVICLVALSQR